MRLYLKEIMFFSVLKKSFWSAYDYLGTVLALSATWCLLHSPLIGVIVFSVFSKERDLLVALTAFNALWTSPVSAGVVRVAGRMIEDSPSAKKWTVFFEGMMRFGLRSLVLCVLDSMVFYGLARALRFWFLNLLSLPLFISWAAAGLVIWILLFQAALKFSLLPLLVLRGETLRSALKKACLVVLARKRAHLAAGLLALSLLIIALFSGLGFLLLYPVFFFVLASVFTLTVLSAYNPEVKVEPETRTWRNLLRPWE
jgi:hypothetical protein